MNEWRNDPEENFKFISQKVQLGKSGNFTILVQTSCRIFSRIQKFFILDRQIYKVQEMEAFGIHSFKRYYN